MTARELFDTIRSSMKILISYRKRDRVSMMYIYSELKERGIEAFYDDLLTPGEYNVDEIAAQFEQASKFGAIIFLLSEKSLEPQNYQIKTEMPMAVQRGANIIPVWIGEGSWESVKDNFYRYYSDSRTCRIVDGEGDLSKVPGKIIEAINEICKGYIRAMPAELRDELKKEAESSVSSISNSITKDSVFEDFSIATEAISNEQIRKGDEILETYEVTSDAIYGGMGGVWRVHHKNWDVDLAMKRAQPKFFAEGSERRKEAFVAECENWIKLGLHPNIVSCYYVREISGVPSIFSEWMDNGSLKDRIRDGLYDGTEQEVQERILDIAIQTARGLQYSHDKGLIHQDVKPGNILLTKDWEAKVADFGLAGAQSHLADGAVQAVSGYTLQYCPKEQVEASKAGTESAEKWMDAYAWALTVLEMYAEKRLWETGAEAADHFDEYPALCVHPLPDRMQVLLRSCLTDRQSSMKEIAQQLTEIYRESVGEEYSRKEPKEAEDVAGSINNRALSYLDLGKTEEAEKLWAQAQVLAPAHVETAFNQGLYLWRGGQISDLEAVQKLTWTEQGAQRQYALALLHLERGAGLEAENALSEIKSGKLSGGGSDPDLATVLEEARRMGQPELVAHLQGTALNKKMYDDPHFKNVAEVSFSGDGTFLYARDRARIKEDKFTYHKGHVNLWKRTGGDFAKFADLGKVPEGTSWNMHSSLTQVVNNTEFVLSNVRDYVRNGVWQARENKKRIRYTHLWNIPADRVYYCIGISRETAMIACGGADNTVDVYSMPCLDYKAPWMLCRVKSQKEVSKENDLFRQIAAKAEEALEQREIQTAVECVNELRPLINSSNQRQYRLLNAKLGKFCVPKALHAIYPDPLREPPAPDQEKISWVRLQKKDNRVTPVLSPDAFSVAFVGIDEDGDRALYHCAAQSHRELFCWYEYKETIGDVQFLPDSSAILAAFCESLSAVLVDAKDARVLQRFPGRKKSFTEDAFVRVSPDGRKIVYGRTGQSKANRGVILEPLRFANVKGGVQGASELLPQVFDNYIHDAEFTQYDRWFVTKHFDNSIRIWDMDNGMTCTQTMSASDQTRLSSMISGGQFDWVYEFPGFCDWDDRALPYLEKLLKHHPAWGQSAFEELIHELQDHGLGYIRPEGVRAQLQKMPLTGSTPEKKKTGFFSFFRSW